MTAKETKIAIGAGIALIVFLIFAAWLLKAPVEPLPVSPPSEVAPAPVAPAIPVIESIPCPNDVCPS